MIRKKINLVVTLNVKLLGANQLEMSSKQWEIQTWSLGGRCMWQLQGDPIQLHKMKSGATPDFKECPEMEGEMEGKGRRKEKGREEGTVRERTGRRKGKGRPKTLPPRDI